MSAAEERFACSGCGRSFRWKAEIAGKRMRCRCGQPVLVPQSRAIEIDDAEYDRQLELPAAPPPFAVAAIPTLGYQTQETPNHTRIHPVRDILVPSLILLAGMVILSLSFTGSRSRLLLLVAVWLLIAVTALPAILVFLGYGLVNARRLKIAIGSFFIASLKFVAVIVATDSAIATLSAFGGFRWNPAYLFASFCCAAVVIAGTYGCFFSSREDDFHASGLLLSIGMWVIHFLLLIFAFGVLASIANVKRAKVVTAPAVPSPSPWLLARSGPISDREIKTAAAQGLLVREGREWKGMRLGNNSAADALVEGLYSAGANKVYIDMRNGGIIHPAVAYVELPSDPAALAKCLSVYQTYVVATQMPPRTIIPATTQSFTVFPLR